MSERPILRTGGPHDRAIDQAIELLGAVLRQEAELGANRRAQLLRGRLAGSSQQALRDRVAASTARTSTATPRT